MNGRELGWERYFGRFEVTPFAAVQFAELWQPGFTESTTTTMGAPGILGLSYASKVISSLPTFLGAQVDGHLILPNGTPISPYARVSWVHEFEPTRDITATFISLPLATFTVDGPRAASDAARIDAGVKVAIGRNAWLVGSFLGEFSGISQMYGGKGGFQITW